VYNGEANTIVFNQIKNSAKGTITFIKVDSEDMTSAILSILFDHQIQSVIVEGGPATMQKFIDSHSWDEARIITNESMTIEKGTPAPELRNFKMVAQEKYQSDVISFYHHI
jgi:diaminohydroxyphosphoribosylaminopyrimidine deaminase/5-amino-6-(5-phosphoribosylamino)uracil reductase